MPFEARIETLKGALPKVTYRWDSETDILSVACKTSGRTSGMTGMVDLEGGDGSFVILDIGAGVLRGLDVVAWPEDIRTNAGLKVPSPEKNARVIFPTRPSQPGVAAVEVDTSLTVEKNTDESVLHLAVGHIRPASVVAVGDYLLVEVDKKSRLAGLWLLNVPPFPTPAES